MVPETPISEWYTGYCWPIISSMRADWILLSHPTLGWGSSHSLLPICTPLASSSSESKMGPYMPHGWRETQELRCCQSRALRQGFVLEEQRKGEGEQNHQAVSLCEPLWATVTSLGEAEPPWICFPPPDQLQTGCKMSTTIRESLSYSTWSPFSLSSSSVLWAQVKPAPLQPLKHQLLFF